MRRQGSGPVGGARREGIPRRSKPPTSAGWSRGMSGKRPQALVMTDDGLNVTGDYLRTVAPDVDETGKPQVSFSFNSEGAFLFGQLTGEHLPTATGQQYNLGILLDNRLLSAPTIESKITDRGRISGNMTRGRSRLPRRHPQGRPACRRRSTRCRSAAPRSARRSAPRRSRRASIALGISLALVALFMVVVLPRRPASSPCIGLAINMLLIVGCMVLIKAAFTLPGLAGLVLTVGMSVDANVLIYERIREELKRGAALRMAIRNGFDRATHDDHRLERHQPDHRHRHLQDRPRQREGLRRHARARHRDEHLRRRVPHAHRVRRGRARGTGSRRCGCGSSSARRTSTSSAGAASCIAASLVVIGVGLLAVAARRRRPARHRLHRRQLGAVRAATTTRRWTFDEVLDVLAEHGAGRGQNLSLVEVGETEHALHGDDGQRRRRPRSSRF